jgi:hypothetical protein
MPPVTKQRSTDAPGEFVQPIEPATGALKGEPFVLNPREIFAATHPIVRSHPHLFRPVEESRPAVERATATPGELRG